MTCASSLPTAAPGHGAARRRVPRHPDDAAAAAAVWRPAGGAAPAAVPAAVPACLRRGAAWLPATVLSAAGRRHLLWSLKHEMRRHRPATSKPQCWSGPSGTCNRACSTAGAPSRGLPAMLSGRRRPSACDMGSVAPGPGVKAAAVLAPGTWGCQGMPWPGKPRQGVIPARVAAEAAAALLQRWLRCHSDVEPSQ